MTEILSLRMCWYLYYIPCMMIPTLGLNAAILMGEEEEKNTKKRTAALVIPAILFVVAVLTNDFHQLVFSFPNGEAVYRSKLSVRTGFLWDSDMGDFLSVAMEVILIRKSKVRRKEDFGFHFFRE